jgi:radical SAM/Cys-rich protein
MNEFESKIHEFTGNGLSTNGIHTLQVNIGLRCNHTCTHCHVGASPQRTERMSRHTMQQVLSVARKMRPRLVDITGGAPELNPDLAWFVTALKNDGHPVQVRTNLTVLLEPGMERMIQFYKDHAVKLVASFPCYMRPEVDNVRGAGVFDKSLEALRRLNAAGYGIEGILILDLVFNPEHDFLPAPQAELEQEYREELRKLGISFNNLLTITNMSVGRFWDKLRDEKKDAAYMRLLKENFNPGTLDKLMCRSQIDVGWDGRVYDCDFNLACNLPARFGSRPDEASLIENYDPVRDGQRDIVTANHCFGCTAGAGSSCGGALER